MRWRFLLKTEGHERLRDDRVYEDEPPTERDIVEATILRERIKVRVVSIHWPDRTGITPAEVTVERVDKLPQSLMGQDATFTSR